MKLGEVVRQYRDEHSLTMDDFSRISGLSKGYISMLEANRNPRTSKPITPSVDTIRIVANAMGLSTAELVDLLEDAQPLSLASSQELCKSSHGVRIPVLGHVAAGIPIEAIEDVIDYEEIPQAMAKNGEYFGLRIRGNSMEPRILEGDVVIVRKQPEVESGEIAVVLVNGDEATCKRVIKNDAGITLVALNVAAYPPHFYTVQEVVSLPITIIGKVVELRGKI